MSNRNRENPRRGSFSRTVLFVLLSLALAGALAFKTGLIEKVLPKTTAEAYREKTFTLDRQFEDVRKSLLQGKFEEEILRANNATVVSQNWLRSNLHVEKPLRPDRYWAFEGLMTAQISVDDPKHGKMVVEMNHEILIAIDAVRIKVRLAKPLDVGVTHMDEYLEILPDGKGRTSVKITSYIRLCRFIPEFYKPQAQQMLDEAVDHSIGSLENAIRTMPPVRGFQIPLKMNK